MFRNYIKIALRQLLKQKMYSVIKIGGFALSIAACLLISLYIKQELSYDQDNPEGDHIYRLVGEMTRNGITNKGVSFQAPMAKALKADFPEIEKSGRIMPNPLFNGAGSNQVRTESQKENTYEDGFCFADQEVLDILHIPIIQGDRLHALTEPFSIVISRSMAEKYFPNQEAVGKLIFLNDRVQKPIKVGGVMEDFPPTSHLQYKFLISLAGASLWEGEQETWNASNYGVYLLMRPGTDILQFEKKMTTTVLQKYIVPSMQAAGSSEINNVLNNAKLHMQALKNIHLKSYDIRETDIVRGDIRFIWLFGSIAVFILVIACINFINLSTAKSANRAKEVGLRKVVGSYRSSLIGQFLTESTLFSLFSFIIGLLAARLLLPYFNLLAGKRLVIPWNEWWLLPVALAAVLVIGIIAGIYPAIYLSAFKPINVLKGQLSRGSKNSVLRNGLVVFQFTTSIILIIGTFVIYNQMQYIQNKKLGFNKEHVVMIEGANSIAGNTISFKQELQKLSKVKSVSVSDYLPVDGTKRNGNTFSIEGKRTQDPEVGGQFWIIDHDYLNTLGIKLTAGRNFSATMPSDSQAVIINQTLATKLNLKDPVGKRITNGMGVFTVIGVAADFHFQSLRNNIEGLCMQLGNSPSIVSVKVSGGDMQQTLASINSVWKSFVPAQPLRYTFLDESFSNMYSDVQRTGRIFTSFALFAIFIACLGLFALSAFMADQRKKEVSIHKVLGASLKQVSLLLSKDFLKLVLLAFVIASPIAWWAMNKWLEDFVYRIHISAWVFIVTGIISLLIALLTVSFQALKAALANPVKSLRAE